MDFWRTLQVLVRRWYVVLPAFLATLAGAAAIYVSTPDFYVSHSVLVLTTPLTGGSQPEEEKRNTDVINPLLNFEHGLSISTSILIQALGNPEVVSALGASPSGPIRYTVSNGSTNPELLTTGPFLFIQGESETAADARAIVQRVAQRAEVELAARQDALDVPRSTYISLNDVVPPTTPVAERGSQSRAMAVALGLGLGISLWTAYAVDSFAAARRARRRELERAAEPVGAQ